MPQSEGPLPTLIADVWNAIKDLDLAANGGWTIATVEHFLYLIRVNSTGATRWDLKPAADAPDGAFQAPMSSGDWADLKGGTLTEATNIITVGASDHHITFYNDGGEAKAGREDA